MYIIHVAPHYRIGLNDELCTMNVNAQPSQSQADSSFSTEFVFDLLSALAALTCC